MVIKILSQRTITTLSKLSVPPLISTGYLENNLKSVVPIYAFLAMKHNPDLTFEKMRIKNSRKFDIDHVSDKSTMLPHMVPTKFEFEKFMTKLNIHNDDHIVIYDSVGIFSSCRVFWTFKYFGHDKVSVLDGGLPKWLAENRQVTNSDYVVDNSKGKYKVDKINEKLIAKYTDVLELAKKDTLKECNIFDARPYSSDIYRFLAKEDEPRPNTPRGNIKNSFSFPFTDVLKISKIHNTNVTIFKQPEEIRSIIKEKNIVPDTPIITSCGSGITACITYFAVAYTSNYEIDSSIPLNKEVCDVSVYDGSWAEYSTQEDSIKVVS